MPLRPTIVVTAVAMLLATTSVALAVPASAAAGDPLTVVYDAVGSTLIARSGVQVPLGPTTLTSQVDLDTADLTATLPLPPAHVSFDAYGVIPIQADVVFVQVGTGTGHLDTTVTPFTVSATAQYTVFLRKVTINGQKVDVGGGCRTTTPVTVSVATPRGKGFGIDAGGPVRGSYPIRPFQNCGSTTDLVNILVPGPANRIELTLSNGRPAGAVAR